MDTLYKYSTKIESFFYQPTLKFSVPGFINDPFESSIARSITEYLDIKTADALEFDMNNELMNVGIVSFSETSRNLLMWAHYADQHHGMCIGFSCDVLSELNTENERFLQYHTLLPVKVNYDNLRVDLKELKSKDHSVYEEGLKRTLTTRSDEWIYEKEHRCIVPIGWSDRAFLIEENKKVKQALDTYHPQNYKFNIDTGEITSTMKSIVFEDLCYYKGMLFLKDILPKSVKSIHLGYRFGRDEALKLAENLKKPSHPLHHIELFQYKLSKTRFELEEFEIYPNNTLHI
ncbi:DUF2971 domain-containing protein [Aeromonas veronii]|uniref:DUF2971 domain-containing protein n=1 Tax=Aeromonas veronii TaxID=654 RepID=UPI0035B93B25